MKTKILSILVFVMCLVSYGNHFQSDGNGGYWLPNGKWPQLCRTEAAVFGFRTARVRIMSDGNGGYWLPNGKGRIIPDGSGGFWKNN